jgi:hypothetical protein
MSLFKRHIGRHVTLVGVAVALLVLGLEAPAFAAAPTITGFTPASGPIGCVVDITGTGFTDFPNPDVNWLEAAVVVDTSVDTTVISATEIAAEVPAALLAGHAYTIEVSNPGGDADSATTFVVTTGAGGCAPTVTAFTPGCGSAGTTVTITGTNLLQDTATGIVGGDVFFNPYTAAELAVATVPNVDTGTTLARIVPATAADGPIKVDNGVTTAFSDTPFQVPPPDCTTGPTEHARSVTLKLAKALVAKGKVSVGDGFTDCAASVPVKIQRRVSGHWKTVGKTTTTDTGAYKKRIKNRHGKYRSLAPKVSLNDGADLCLRAKSRVVKH